MSLFRKIFCRQIFLCNLGMSCRTHQLLGSSCFGTRWPLFGILFDRERLLYPAGSASSSQSIEESLYLISKYLIHMNRPYFLDLDKVFGTSRIHCNFHLQALFHAGQCIPHLRTCAASRSYRDRSLYRCHPPAAAQSESRYPASR